MLRPASTLVALGATLLLPVSSPAARAQEPEIAVKPRPAFPPQKTPLLAFALVTDEVQARDEAQVVVMMRRPNRCALTLRGPHGMRSGPHPARFNRTYGSWSWQVPSDVRGGRWTARVTCKTSTRRRASAAAPIQVAFTERGMSALAPRRGVTTASRSRPPTPTQIAEVGGKGTGGGYPHNDALCKWTGRRGGACRNYDWGYRHPNGTWSVLSSRGFSYRNCTDFAAWVIGATWSSFRFPNGHGHAANWRAAAGNIGLQVRSTASVGDVAWWGNPAPYGHVAIVTAVNSNGTVTTVDYNGDGRGNYTVRPNTRAEAYLHRPGGAVANDPLPGGGTAPGGGTTPGGEGAPGQPPAPTPPNLTGSGWQTAFQANDGTLWTVGGDNRGAMSLGMAAGTSPSIARVNGGGWQTAFQASDNRLWIIGKDNRGSMNLGMKPGTSPSITGLSTGGWQTAFHSPGGTLWVIGADTKGDMGLGMAPGTSPSVAGMADGGWQTAFQASDNTLWIVGKDNRGAMNLGMKPESSPSITGVEGGGWQTAFQAPSGSLWVIGKDNKGDMGLRLAPGTSPSITGMAGGGWQAAFQASDNTLWVVGKDNKGAMGLGIKEGTSPSIMGLAGGGWQAAFQAPDGGLWVVGSDNKGALNLGMAAGTSPAITSYSPG